MTGTVFVPEYQHAGWQHGDILVMRRGDQFDLFGGG